MLDELCIKASELTKKISEARKKIETMLPGLERAQTKGWMEAWEQEYERVMADINKESEIQ